MKKLLVTTDYSDNSKAGIRFAIQMQIQSGCELVFFHTFQSASRSKKLVSFEDNELEREKERLNSFVKSIYRSSGVKASDYKCIVKESFLTDSTIAKFAEDNKFDFICISRRGEGSTSKLFGTNTTNLILHSKVPVIAVPPYYRRSAVKHLLYPTDLSAIGSELMSIMRFAEPLKAQVRVLHFTYAGARDTAAAQLEAAIRKFPKSEISYQIEAAKLENTLANNILDVVKVRKPSCLAMFTNQNQSFFEKLFFTGSTAQYSVSSPVPLIIFPKSAKASK